MLSQYFLAILANGAEKNNNFHLVSLYFAELDSRKAELVALVTSEKQKLDVKVAKLLMCARFVFSFHCRVKNHKSKSSLKLLSVKILFFCDSVI